MRHFTAEGISAFIIPRTGGESGDALLIDCGRRILAVADGPERNPEASAAFLEKFQARVAQADAWKKDVFTDIFHDLVAITNTLMRESSYHESTTFSAVIIGNNGRSGLLHTGDSLIFRIDSRGVQQLSHTNHCLVGRSPHLHQNELFPHTPDDTILLASDGLTDLARYYGCNPQDFLSGLFENCAGLSALEGISLCASEVDARLDDIGIIGVLPVQLNTEPHTALLCERGYKGAA